MMYNITQLWSLSPTFIPGLRETFCQKSHAYQHYISIRQSIRQYRVVLAWVIFHQRQEFKFENFAGLKFCSIKLEQPSTKQNEPIEVLILKFGDLSSLMCFSALNLQPKYLKKNRICGENVKYCSHLKCFKTKQIT